MHSGFGSKTMVFQACKSSIAEAISIHHETNFRKKILEATETPLSPKMRKSLDSLTEQNHFVLALELFFVAYYEIHSVSQLYSSLNHHHGP